MTQSILEGDDCQSEQTRRSAIGPQVQKMIPRILADHAF